MLRLHAAFAVSTPVGILNSDIAVDVDAVVAILDAVPLLLLVLLQLTVPSCCCVVLII